MADQPPSYPSHASSPDESNSAYHRYKTIAIQIAVTASIGTAIGSCFRMATLKPNPLNSIYATESEKLKKKVLPASLRKDAAALYSSAVAGTFAGGFVSVLRAILPGMLFFGLGAGLIQGTYTELYRYRQDLLMDKSKPKAAARPPGWWLDMIVACLPDWCRVSKIPDDEYAGILEAKLDQLNALLAKAEADLEGVKAALDKEAANRKVIPLPEKP